MNNNKFAQELQNECERLFAILEGFEVLKDADENKRSLIKINIRNMALNILKANRQHSDTLYDDFKSINL